VAPTLTVHGPTVLRFTKLISNGVKKMDTGRIMGIVIGILLVGGLVAADIFLLWG
jgi:hypothetical protein